MDGLKPIPTSHLYYKLAFRSLKAPAPSTREAADKSADSVGVETPTLPQGMNGWVETHPYQPPLLQAGFQEPEGPCSLRIEFFFRG
jgi:hypothetical protein